MGMGYLSETEINDLKSNPFVVDADSRNIFYTAEFKKYFMERYNSGEKPSQIFRSAGFDTGVLGPKRIERATARWKCLFASGGYEAFDSEAIKNERCSNRTRLINNKAELERRLEEVERVAEKDQKELQKSYGEIMRLQRKVILLYAENERLRKRLDGINEPELCLETM